MDWKWRSQSWRAAHPRSFSDRAGYLLRLVLRPVRRALGKIASPERPTYIDLAADFKVMQQIEGDYCEFGVYTGRSFVHAYHAIMRLERTKGQMGTRFYAFDSFQGLPKIGAVDSVYPQFARGGLAATEAEFIANCRKHKLDLTKVKIVPGWYSEVLRKESVAVIGLSQVAIANIDCDLYESTIPVLDFLTDLLVDGAVLIFDDWSLFRAHPDLGVQRAFHEWANRNAYLRFSTLGCIQGSLQNAFIVHRPLETHRQKEVVYEDSNRLGRHYLPYEGTESVLRRPGAIAGRR